MSQGSGRPGALGFLFEQWGSGFSPRAPLLQVACRHSLRLGRGLVTGLWIIVTLRLQYEDDYKYKFSILSVSARAQNLKLVVVVVLKLQYEGRYCWPRGVVPSSRGWVTDQSQGCLGHLTSTCIECYQM